MAAASAPPERRLIVLGSTGSIGVSTLQVVEHLVAQGSVALRVTGLAAGRNTALLVEQAQRLRAPAVAIADAGAAERVRAALPGVRVYAGADSAQRLVEDSDATDLSAAIVGASGLPATVAGVRQGMRIGLANKETLVAAGALVTPLARRQGAALFPVDSEHSAIFQCLATQAPATRDPVPAGPGGPPPRSSPGTVIDTRRVKRVVLTASGGPFRAASVEKMATASVEEALAHPTWKMGAKITIDSATMMNKALEIIEAHWLFDLPPQQIAVIIHPQSVVHSFVEFADNSVLAQMGPPDMRTPIQYALTYPERPEGCSRPMDWTTLSRLDFEPPDPRRFPALGLAYEVIEAGGTAGAVFNAANEAAVGAFLERRIRFGRIVELVAEALSAIPPTPVESLATVLEADRAARAYVAGRLAG